MPYYRIQLGNRQSVIKDERTLQEVGESYKDRLIGECDYLGHLQVPYISPEAEAMLKEAAEEFDATHTWVDGKFIKVYNPDGERGSPIQDPINTDNVAGTIKVATSVPYNNATVNRMIEGTMQDKPTYGKAIMAQKDALGLSPLDKSCILEGYEFPVTWDLAERLPERMSPTYKRRWNIEINGSSYWIYAMHRSQVEHYTKMYGEGEAPKTVEYQIEARRPDPFKEAFEVQTPVTPEEVGVVELTPDGSYEAGLQLEQAVKFYQCIEEQKATVQPHLVDLTSNQLIVESLVDNPILTVAEFRANFPKYPIEVYHDYLRNKMSAWARANKPFMVEDNDTLAEIQIAIQGQSAFSAERIRNEGLGLDQFIQGIQSETVLLDPNDANPMGEEPSDVVRTLRKKILVELDKWWAECLTRFDLNVTYGDRRSEFIRKEYLRHRKYLKHMLLDVIEPHDTIDNIVIDTAQWNVFNLLGKNDEGEWIRPVALTFNHVRGHFELFENLED